MEFFSFVKEGDVDLNVSPQAIDKLLGYVLAFKVKVQPKFNNVAVLRYSNDLDLVNAVVDMLPDAEVMFCKACCSHYCHICYPKLISYTGMFQGSCSYP